MPSIQVFGVQVHYRLDGAADAPLLMLSNSLGTDVSMWEAQLPSLTQRFRVLRYDTRGHGGSAVTPGPYSIELLGRDALGLLDALRLERVRFCGLSMGGMIGMWLGIHAPERVDKLALCNTAALIGPADRWNTRIEAVRSRGMDSIATGVLGGWCTAEFVARAPEEMQRLRAVLVATPPAGYIACCEAVRDADQREAAAQIRIPTLVLSGTYDQATPPADARFLAKTIAGARYIELPAAHLSNIEAAEDFSAALRRFMSA